MSWKLRLAALSALGIAIVAQAEPDPAVARILKQYEAAVPGDQKLAFYTHDWTPDLATAKARAAKEGRPIFLVWVTNISATPSFFSGHC